MSSASTAAAFYASTISASQMTGAIPEDTEVNAHHAKGGKGYINPWPSFVDPVRWANFQAVIMRKVRGQGNSPKTTPPTVPIRKPNFLPTRETSTLRATWLGHACYYVEFPGGLRVLFDPVFTHRCSPFSWLGPARYTPAPCEISDIPIIDIVVISHNHYDHLSHPTILQIQEKHPNVQFFAPLGNKKWFTASGVHNATELDWWETKDLKLSKMDASKGSAGSTVVNDSSTDKDAAEITATIGCLPCQHMTARTPFDRMSTLWASWSVESGGKKVWFGGDTGYRSVPVESEGKDDYGEEYAHLPHCPAFKQIGDLRGPFDLGLIPIGAYQPRFFMSPMHANPFDSVNIFNDTKCKKAMGIHWGTWVLTEEDVLEPPRLLKEALKKKGLAETGVFDVCDIGDSREF
ncbi:Metallo-hydrolase/oxidoreductase [Tothia fuscella]|uniref:Metallo-hydrolase/oxidoreductase n=1 Tax=Tothia fuscella TaxID=1048955 RepID=A0A9P4NK48_9PEZI|nr:Metallo-hydrolase/oxidoreductase [Tothia fuscella]